MVQEFNKYWIKNQKLAYEMIKELADEQGIKLKEENMEDRNKTAEELIVDLQNQLDKANNRIEELTHKNTKLIVENVLLEEDDVRMNRKYCEYNQAAQDAWNENNKIKKEIEKLKNENEYLEGIIDWVISENNDMSKEITKWHSKYTKEKAKHDKATKKIDELKKNQKNQKNQKDKLAYLKTTINSVYGSTSSDIRRHDNIDSLLYSYWGLKEYYQEAKCNKNEANDAKE